MEEKDILLELKKVQEQYPDLKKVIYADKYELVGLFHFTATFGNVPIDDSFNIRIIVEKDYPNRFPVVEELDGRIDSSFSHFYSRTPLQIKRGQSGLLCLGSRFEMRLHLEADNSLLNFINRFVISYLYAYCYWEIYSIMPYGERSHGIDGDIEFILEYLEIEDPSQILSFANSIANSNFRYIGAKLCPCGSGMQMRDCIHKKLLLSLPSLGFREELLERARYIDLILRGEEHGSDNTPAKAI